ncbi:hypothetical protein D4764_10G0009480 [Takifugu flavidus]|uniref:Alkylated DNA repair protein AlkB homologue 8 N-terminal domain-containing protein n=1 Tax=Takifugu flavidus TaxID=433684 RepID=A0A5C6PMH4_9TELE|nr:hypothetical protein D4764_10G0009480 [Takifugu flavidus]
MFWRLEYFFLCFAVLGLFAAPISWAEKRSGIVYTRDQLMALRPPSFVVGEKPQIPKEVRRKQRGTKAGVKQRMKRRRFKPCVPAVITGNVRSLANKMDELEALTRTQRESREASIMCFTETWLHGLIPDSNVTIAGFTTASGPRHHRGRPDVELIAVGLRPYYLPREFTNVIAITVYIPPTGKADTACDVIHSVTADLQTKHPGAFILITGDFNHASLKSTLPTFHQYVQCSTRDRKTLDLLYANVTNAYCVSDYIKFCTENSVPTKKKKRAFTAGDPAELRSVQKELKRSLKESKDAYRKKVEERLERNQTRDVWSGMRTITGFQKKGIRSADGNVDQANELNQFFNRFLGVQLDNKLEWSTNTNAVYKKAMSRLYFLRRLRSFSVCSRMLHMFYQSVSLASTIFFAVVCWGTGIKAKDANRLNKPVKKAGSVVGCRLDNLDEVVRDRMVLKVQTIMDSPSHPLHNTVDKLRSSFSSRLLQPRCSKERYRKSFLPSAIRLYNSSKPSQ